MMIQQYCIVEIRIDGQSEWKGLSVRQRSSTFLVCRNGRTSQTSAQGRKVESPTPAAGVQNPRISVQIGQRDR
jgi:hypothetical protein